jgi:hypothetical protein
MGQDITFMQFCQKHGKRYGLFGQSYFPSMVEGEGAAERLALLNAAAFIYTRETKTLAILRGAGIKAAALEFGPDGCFGLYIWGQVESDYFLVSVMPELGFELRHLLMSAFPEMELCNHMLITWSQAIPGHHDKRFSARSKQGKNETASEFYCLSIGPPRQMLLLDGNTVVRTIDFKDGDMIAIPGEVNSKLKHQVTGPPLNRGARVSIVWRNVSAHKVNGEESYFIKDGIQSHFAMADRRLQPELPPQLLARLLPLAPTASGSAPADGGSNFDAPSTGSAAEGGGSQDDAEGGGSQDDGAFQNGADHSASQDGVDVNFSC